ncbi:hypothetical protein OS493_022365 [Desmophyllum pertusum]|uniref:DUF4536 domain-containing protein n=1 Tax=Desmophyllum pertusum TaxID=174260 RepID=A0A9X0D8U4_9CNID|nr:hypothetical protein OS493_022365 [Desmophyllum pertusum]
MTSSKDTSPLETLPEIEIDDTKPEKQEEGKWSLMIRKLDIEFNKDCVTCKFVSAATCYGCGMIVLGTLKSIPNSNLPGKILTGLFGIGLFGAGTMRILDDPRARPMDQTPSKSTNQNNS